MRGLFGLLLSLSLSLSLSTFFCIFVSLKTLGVKMDIISIPSSSHNILKYANFSKTDELSIEDYKNMIS